MANLLTKQKSVHLNGQSLWYLFLEQLLKCLPLKQLFFSDAYFYFSFFFSLPTFRNLIMISFRQFYMNLFERLPIQMFGLCPPSFEMLIFSIKYVIFISILLNSEHQLITKTAIYVYPKFKNSDKHRKSYSKSVLFLLVF